LFIGERDDFKISLVLSKSSLLIILRIFCVVPGGLLLFRGVCGMLRFLVAVLSGLFYGFIACSPAWNLIC